MPFSRSNRIDRRRRVIREAVATESEFAVESVRAKRRLRKNDNEEQGRALKTGYRDPGYSQSVRKTCQVRLVQLIPVRPGALSAVLGTMWLIWGALLFAHYWFHVSANGIGRSTIPIAYLFHLRSEHSIAQWMTCQLWMFTAIAGWVIFQLRRHKLDDYQARYRIWIAVAFLAAFSSFDASTSCLRLLGQTIDAWSRAEVGYSGWSLVLATFASLMGLVALRLTSELKETPASIALWFGGLIAWAVSALLGTGLIRTTLTPGTVDMIVGGCWLGGSLAVFQAAGMYLRQSYVHAQRRFLERSSMASKPRSWQMPSLPWKRNREGNIESEREDQPRYGRYADQREPSSKRSWLNWRRNDEDVDDESENESQQERRTSKPKAAEKPKEDKPPSRLFGVFAHRSERNEAIIDEPIREDDGGDIDRGLTKRPGWFGIGGHKDQPVPAKQVAAPKKDDKDDTMELKVPKRGWGISLRRSKATGDEPKPKQEANNSRQSIRVDSIRATTNTNASDSKVDESKKNRGWLPWKRDKNSIAKNDVVSQERDKPKLQSKDRETDSSKGDVSKSESRKVGSIMGWLDGLRLKPPTENESSRGSNNQPVASKPSIAPSTSRTNGPVNQRPLPSTQPIQQDEDDDDVDFRQLSKAERKKMRRQQDDRRAA